MMTLKNSTYFSFFDGKEVAYPELDITVSETDSIFKGDILVEFYNNRYLSKENSIKYFEWVLEQIKSLPDKRLRE